MAKELHIEAVPGNLTVVLDFLKATLGSSDCDEKTINQISIAVEEIFVNIAHYAYNPETGGTVIRVAVSREVVIEFEDGGKPYNPLEKSDPDISLGIEERQIGGLGVFMVKQIMDTVEYRYDNGKNILTIKKVQGG